MQSSQPVKGMESQTTSHSSKANSWKGAVCERRVEVEFAKYGYSTFIPAWGQQPIQDLVAIRGDDVRLIQVKKARRKIDKRGPDGFRQDCIIVTFLSGNSGGGGTVNYKYKRSAYDRNKANFSRSKNEFNTLAVVWEDQVALFDDPRIWENGSLYLSINPEVCKSLPFHNYIEPSWLTGEDQAPVATESQLSVAV